MRANQPTAYRQPWKHCTHDVIIVQADFNATVGSKKEGRERTMGRKVNGM